MAEGTSFQIDLPVSGASAVDAASASLDVLASRMSATGAAAIAASDAVKAGESAYREAETSADRAAKAVEKIGLMADAQQGKLKAALDAGDETKFWKIAGSIEKLKARQEEAIEKSEAAKAALVAEAGALDKLKAAADGAALAETKVSKAHEAASVAATAAAKAQAASAGSGKANEAAEAFGKLGGPIGLVGQKAFGAKAGLDKLFSSLGTSKGLLAVGAVGAAAMAAGVIALGVAAAKATIGILEWSFALNPKNTERVNKQTKALQANLAKVFHLNFDKLLDGFDSLVGLFGETSVTGKAMKVLFESLFQPVIDALVDLVPKATAAFIQIEILVLKAAIAVKPFGSKILLVAEAFGVLAAVVVGIVALALVAVLAIVVSFGVVIVALGAAFSYVGNAAIAFGSSIMAGAGNALTWLRTKFDEVVAFLSGLSLSGIGKSMIDGLVAGITGAAGAVLAAMTGAVDGAIGGAKKLLGIASPSKVFAEIGMNTGEGMAVGVDDASGGVQSALESMVSPPELSAPAPSAAAAPASASGGGSIGGGNTFNFYGVEGAEDALSRFTRLLEGDLAQSGGAVPT